MKRRVLPAGAALVSLTILGGLGPLLLAQPREDRRMAELILDRLPWRNIGPAIMGGRIDDIVAVEADPRVIYVGVATGGLWKTTNNGVTWEAIFDRQPVISIGAVAVAPSNPSIVWVGTGEANNRQSSSWGNGVYRSADGGRTWSHTGLEATQAIGRIVVHPTNPDVVYVAAAGHLWGPNDERGLYKTTDGGRTWVNTKFIDPDTGFIDVATDPMAPETLYAAAYQRRRTVFGFNGGGPGSALYKTTDGGRSWTRLTTGLPEGDTGRIGVAIYRKDPRIVYAVVENLNGGVFRSENGGASWARMSETNPRPLYYSQIRIDPADDRRIWLLGPDMYYSEDGGRTFRTDRVRRIHGDFHAMWINPSNPEHLIVGSDGGIHLSYDRGLSWDFVNTLPLGQFYEIGLDMETPYHVYGGLQDNGIWRGPVRTLDPQGIANDDWFQLGRGDGSFVQPAPGDSSTVYFTAQYGELRRLNLKTFETKNIKPEPPEGERPYRFDWNSPILISPHNPATIYFGGNRLFKSTGRGESWTSGPDLTSNPDRDRLRIMGVVPTENTLSVHDGDATWAEITTIAESPLGEGVLYAGTDDGLLQVSRDGGKTWRNVARRVPGVPDGTYVSRVVASRFAEGRVYATFDGHRNDDLGVYVYVSDNFGETWRSIGGTLPAGHPVAVIREHPRRENLLFVGTEFGAFVSFDRGGRWHRLGGKVPAVPVHDIAIHPRENDLVLATHGRSVYVLDDITPLEQIDEALLDSPLHAFDARPATAFRLHSRKASTGHKVFVAPNPPYGALLSYYVSAPVDQGATITIRDGSGNTVRRLRGPGDAGFNRTNWDLRYPPPVERPRGDDETFLAPPGWRPISFPPGPLVLPGTYTAAVDAGQLHATTTISVLEDSRIQVSAADRRAHLDTVLRVGRLLAALANGDKATDQLSKQLAAAREALMRRPAPPPSVVAPLDALAAKIDALVMRLSRTGGLRRQLGHTGPPPPGRPTPLYPRINRLYLSLEGHTAAPTAAEQERTAALSHELRTLLVDLNRIIAEDVSRLNGLLKQAGVAPIDPGPPVALPGS